MEKLYRVVGPNFVAGFVCKDGYVIRFAPILRKWVMRKEENTVENLKRFKVEEMGSE